MTLKHVLNLCFSRSGQFVPNKSVSSRIPERNETSTDEASCASPVALTPEKSIRRILDDLAVSPDKSLANETDDSYEMYKPSTSEVDTSSVNTPVKKRKKIGKAHCKSGLKQSNTENASSAKKRKSVKKLSCKEKRGWTKEKENLLVELWEEETLLYDFTHKDYKNNTERERAYNRIAANLDMYSKYF